MLDEALSGNINAEIIRLHQEINFGKIRDELEEIETNEAPLKSLFEESEVQIGYIRLAAMKLLMEWMESIKRCNAMYIEHHHEEATPKGTEQGMNGKKDGDGDGAMYQYVTSGVSAMATMVNPFAWKNGAENELPNALEVRESIERKEDTKVLGIESTDIVKQSDFLSVDDAIQIDGNKYNEAAGNEIDEEIDVETTLNTKVEDVAIESASDHSDADAEHSKGDDD